MSGMTIQEQPDIAAIYGEVAWRCHECKKKVERENLHWIACESGSSRLVCVECFPNKGD